MLLNAINGNVSFIDFILYAFSSLIVIFVTLPIHEWAHGFVASKLGDPTAKYMGRLSINPFRHIDWLGAAGIILFGYGWAKPVPVNPSYFKNPKRDMAITALAGPLANLVLAFGCLFIFNLLINLGILSGLSVLITIASLFLYVAQINVRLTVFNLIPLPPLDGSKILAIVLPDRLYYKFMRYERYTYILLLVLIFSGFLDLPLSYLYSYVLYGVNFLAELPLTLIFG